MKKKLGIFVCTLLITVAVLPVAGTVNVVNNKNEEKSVVGLDEVRGEEHLVSGVSHQYRWSDGYNWHIPRNNIFTGHGVNYSYGNVDIGKTSPSSPSDVTDNIKFSGGVILGDGLEEEWNKTFGAPDTFDNGYSVQQTTDGGYITAGNTGYYDFPYSYYDAWLIKTDSYGDEQWNRTFGGEDLEFGNSVQQTSDGGYIVAGGTASFGAGSTDFWLIKTDSTGGEQWNRTYGGTSGDYGYSVQQTSDDGYILTGSAASYGSGSYDIWLVKTGSTGDELWNRTFGGAGDDGSSSVQQTSDGGYILAGYTTSYSATQEDYDVWLVKTDSSGNEQWNKTYGGADLEFGYSVQQTTDGGYIVTGEIGFIESGYGYVLLIKTDSSGDEQWNRTFGAGDDWGSSVQQTIDGGYVIGGTTQSYGAGQSDAWLIKTDSYGDELWNRTFGGTSSDHCYSIQQTNDYGYIFSGSTPSTMSPYYSDVWLVKVAGENQPPNANFTYIPEDPTKHDIIQFSDTSTDLDGTIVSWWWDFGDGYYSDLQNPVYQYYVDGVYNVSLKVTDNGSLTDTIQKSLVVFTPNYPPVFGNPCPVNGSTDQPLNFIWSIPINDPEGDSFDWNIDCSNGQTNSATGDSNGTKTLALTGLLYLTTYIVWVNATDSDGSGMYTRSWFTFTTKSNNPPNPPSDPNPFDGTTNIDINADLSWTCCDPDGDPLTYNVFFEANDPTPDELVSENQTSTVYDPGTMDLNTIYYWQIVAEDSQSESATGPIWSFTTELEPNEPPTAPDIDGPNKGSAGVELCWEFHSDDPDENQIKYNIDWGDGNSSGTGFNAPCTPVEVCHTYEEDGEYVITATAEDEKGLVSEESTFTVKITTPRSRTVYHPMLLQLFERFPNLFPILRYLLSLH